ncbi:MAG: VIT1/CCC1 transporter family protein [Verrucomicrobia bacterium]|nr:VIT1/CCC1 transporter family protein [Verrucomicrobiota bacterium]
MSWTRRLDEARDAYRNRDAQASAVAHDPARIAKAAEGHGGEASRYVGEVVYGSLDGIITTFAVVSGVAGAELGTGVVLILGLANLFGDGLSMAAGAYLSARSDREYYQRERAREEWEIEHFPDGERAELEEVYLKMGFSPQDAADLVRIQSKDRRLWVDMMMVHELGMLREDHRPLRAALTTFASFAVAGAVPLLVYLAGLAVDIPADSKFWLSVGSTAVALFGLGAAKTLVTGVHWLRAGIEMLAVGSLAAAVAYGIGVALRGLGV